MTDRELLEEVRRRRAEGAPPKAIARALGVRPAVIPRSCGRSPRAPVFSIGPVSEASSPVMGKRARRHLSNGTFARERSLLDAIADGELDDHLAALADAVDARRRLLHAVRSATALAALCVGDRVRINHAVSPRYLVGLQGTVVEVDDRVATIRLPRPVGRFSSGQVRCPPLALDRLATAPS